MKNTLKHITLLLLAFSITLISCKKNTDDDNPDGDGGDGDNTATCRIKKIIPSDDEEITFIYNTDNRLTSMTNGSETVIELVYNTDGTIQKTLSIDSESESDMLTFSVTYEYNTAGLPITSVATDGDITMNFTYHFTDEKLTKRAGTVIIDGITATLVENYTYVGDNVSETEIITTWPGYSDTKHIYYEYDNKKNPFYDLNVQHTVIAHKEDFALFASKNNYTSMTATYADGTVIPDESDSITFEYNSDNYPSKSTFADGSYSDITYHPCH